MSIYTCITCRVAFADADLQRAHYKTDWHRYNLKRKVAELPPVTAENFQLRVMSQRAQLEEQAQDKSGHCAICNKHFGTKNAYSNHLQSKKHKEVEAKQRNKLEKSGAKSDASLPSEAEKMIQDKNAKNEAIRQQTATGSSASASATSGDAEMDSDSESVESWDGEALGEEECLFCSHVSTSLEQNVKHMTTEHSFFIPDVEFLHDLPGLITYLGQKVGEGHVCLWCNEKGKAFVTTKSVQQHMLDKGHCKLLHEDEAVFEYADFYDYRSSYPDHESRQDEPMEATGGADAGDEEVEIDELDKGNFQLVLPSGSMVGHRSLQRYYKQKLKPTRAPTRTAVSNVISHYRALGWTGTVGASAEKRAKDVAFVQRIRSKQQMKWGMKNNNQKHFREQVVF